MKTGDGLVMRFYTKEYFHEENRQLIPDNWHKVADKEYSDYEFQKLYKRMRRKCVWLDASLDIVHFNKKESVQNFDEFYNDNLQEDLDWIPQWIMESVDQRLLALRCMPAPMFKKIKDNYKAFEKHSDNLRKKYYGSMAKDFPEDWWPLEIADLEAHTCFLKDNCLTFRGDIYELVQFIDVEITEDELGLGNCKPAWMKAFEIYRTLDNEKFEIHMLFASKLESVRAEYYNVIFLCSDISYPEERENNQENRYTEDGHFSYGIEKIHGGYMPFVLERYYDEFSKSYYYFEYEGMEGNGHLSIVESEDAAWAEAQRRLAYAIEHPNNEEPIDASIGVAGENSEERVEDMQNDKKRWVRRIVWSLIAIAIIVWLIATSAHIGRPVSAVATFHYGDVHVEEPMKEKDMLQVWRAVNLHHLSRHTIPSCGFSDDCSVTLVDKKGVKTTVCFACDDCANYYIAEEDAYSTTTRYRGDKVKEMLKAYGFVFPCE